ncbi:erythromycin esterase family protein [Rhodohalobacter sp. SW132]|uniref:erythromycin esterase family protein n=1 Tax=Rhodohalobacter sp. SW132 TaxID=2293433 RepID=UPI000E24FD2A|nr:erythromycin esterase family protein [Rhodohalobacter sp. SW132]REL38566.1 erythromycin esterase family protein [Rhodohalobacter sp. SW132]
MQKLTFLRYLLRALSLLLLFSGCIFMALPADAQQAGDLISQNAIPFETADDFDELINQAGERTLVLMGEASHGTSEFYTQRAELSKRLIEEKGFNFIAVEGDWPAMSRINEYVKHIETGPGTLEEAMNYINRWPLWMWRNHEVKDLLSWLHEYNRDLNPDERVGFYGVDLYAKQDAMGQVISYLEEIDPDLASRADRNFACMTRHGSIQQYLQMVSQSGEDCSEDFADVLQLVRENTEKGWHFFNAEQNTKVAMNAEEHYRGNLMRGAQSWNARASHFYLTAERLLSFYGEGSRGIVWAHNTHIGDARATDMARQGAHNIGQLAREDLGEENVFAIGFGTYEGHVLAGREWEAEMEVMRTPQARSGSWEEMLEATGLPRFYLIFDNEELNSALQSSIPHRAIGVTYNPANESQGNYVNTILPDRYNAFVFTRETDILEVLD